MASLRFGRTGWPTRGNGRARGTAIAALAGTLIAALGTGGAAAGVANAAATGTAPEAAVTGAATADGAVASGGAVTTGGHAVPATGAKECFYTVPDCTSTDPAVKFRIVSNGGSGACTFRYKTVWGDGRSETKSFPGGPDGATLAKFTHTYDDRHPRTWTVTVTGSVTSGTRCRADSATLRFTLLPKLGAGAVRFAPLAGQSSNTTPGLPVIKDDGPSFTKDNEFGPVNCDGINSPRDYDYEHCGTPVPAGPPSKIWPVIYTRGDSLTLDQVVFVANGRVPDPRLTATASLTGSARASFTLPATALAQTTADRHTLLTGSSLAFTGALPSVPGRDTLKIKWTVTDVTSGVEVASVTTSHVIYMTAGTYTAPAGVPVSNQKPFETVLDTGIAAASGASGQQQVFGAIWKKFTTLTIRHPILDPATGLVSDGKAITYYNNGFTTLSDGFNGNRAGCTSLNLMLHADTGRCGAWAMFFAMVMAFQGITAQAADLGAETGANGFQPGPAPGGGCSAADCAYMLAGPGLWHFAGATGGGNYPFRDRLTVTPAGAIRISGTQVTYASTSPVGQGPVSTPPMWFTDGDHTIDAVSLPGGTTWVDPSYGDPMPPLAPFATVRAYEPHALAGFAVVYQETGTTLEPLPATYGESAIASACAHTTCFFQAAEGVQTQP